MSSTHLPLATAFQPSAIRRPGVVAEPAEGFEAATEAFCDARREPGVRVVEAAGEEIAFAGAMQSEEASVTLARKTRRGKPRRRNSGGKPPHSTWAFAILGSIRQALCGTLCAGRVFAIHQQIHLAGEASERGHHGAAVVIFDDELRNENWVGEIGERVVEALRRVHATQSVEIGGRVFADEQWGRVP